MNVTTLLIVIAGLLAFLDLVRSEGRNLTAWAILALCVALVWRQF